MALLNFVAVTIAATATLTVGDSPPCTCMEILKDSGVPMATPGGGDGTSHFVAAKMNYEMFPSDYGASCKKHHETGHASCYNLSTGMELPVGVRKSWCDKVWCFVDPCTCNLTDVSGGASSYFLNKNGIAPMLAYSYVNCNSSTIDSSNFGHSTDLNKTEFSCGLACKCQSLPATVPMTKDGMHAVASKKQYAKYPSDYGGHCGKHLEPGSADCYNLTTGEELPTGTREAWCDKVWCIVDPCTCKLSDVGGGSSAYFTAKDGTAIHVAYSYDNCKAGSGTPSTFDRVAYCDDPLTCGAVKQFYKDGECCGTPAKTITKPAWR